jgi:ABC-2 type transport system ATP-binding protein
MIEVRGLTKRYGSTLAVDQVSFTVEKGEVLGFLGPNGAGKTTTMRMLTCFMPADAGSATVAGFDIHTQPLEVRRHLGYLPENSPLYLDMVVYDYLLFIARIRGIASPQRKGRVRKMVDACGLESVVGKEIGQLSKGYRQRVGLAQTLIHEPEILVLDEPTSGLDPNQIVEIRDLIRNLGKERTVVLSTHILSEVEATCGRVIIVNEGRIAASGTPAELAAQARGGTYYSLLLRAPESLALPALSRLDGVKSAIREATAGTPDGWIKVRVDCGEKADLGEAIFHAIARNGWSLSELRRETASLEHVFRQLTGRGA